jgi:two-component system sensor histidine kinase YesM
MRWFKGITFKLFLVCFIFVLGSVSLVGVMSYRYIDNEIRNSQLEYANQMLSKLEQFWDLYYLLLQSNLNSLASSSPMWNGDLAIAQSQLIRTYEDNLAYFSNVYLINPDLSIVGGNPVTKVLDEPREERAALFHKALEGGLGGVILSEPYRSTYSGWTVTAAKSVPWAAHPLVVAIDLSLSGIEDRMLKISSSNDYQLGVMAPSGLRVALSYRVRSLIREQEHQLSVGRLSSSSMTIPKDETLTTEADDGAPLILIKKLMVKFGWTVFAVLDESRLDRSLREMQFYFGGLLAVGVALSLTVSIIITRYIRKPVFYLIHKMRLVREGNLEVRVAGRRDDEFGELASSFDDTLEQIRKLIRDLNTSEALKRKLEIQVLQSQINPHFLYNTLGAVSNLVDLGRYDKVDPLISSLISILEYGIADGSKLVSLQEELANVEHYMRIQNIRYQKNFHLAIDMPDILPEVRLPRMILQPIVENSLFHGYRGGLLQGDIRILVSHSNGLLSIEIADTGVGMDEAKCLNILAVQEIGEFPSNRRRIGLYNIHKRLQLNYGEDYGIRLISKPGAGTTVRIELPEGGSST